MVSNIKWYKQIIDMEVFCNLVSVTSFRCKSWFVVSESDPFSLEHFGQETVLAVESSSPFRRPSVARGQLARKYNLGKL